jgi:hypothetical protein
MSPVYKCQYPECSHPQDESQDYIETIGLTGYFHFDCELLALTDYQTKLATETIFIWTKIEELRIGAY